MVPRVDRADHRPDWGCCQDRFPDWDCYLGLPLPPDLEDDAGVEQCQEVGAGAVQDVVDGGVHVVEWRVAGVAHEDVVDGHGVAVQGV